MSSDAGTNWPLVAASFAMMRSEDSLNSERSFGVAIFANCNAASAEIDRFSAAAGMADAMLALSINFYPEIRAALGLLYVGTELERNITGLKAFMLTDDFQSTCAAMSAVDRTAMTNTWRNNMWTYLLNIIDKIRTDDVMNTFVEVQ